MTDRKIITRMQYTYRDVPWSDLPDAPKHTDEEFDELDKRLTEQILFYLDEKHKCESLEARIKELEEENKGLRDLLADTHPEKADETPDKYTHHFKMVYHYDEVKGGYAFRESKFVCDRCKNEVDALSLFGGQMVCDRCKDRTIPGEKA